MIRSPLFFIAGRKVLIDLSQLAEVGDVWWVGDRRPMFFDPDDPLQWPSFSYRYATSPDLIVFRRPFRRGPDRWQNLELVDSTEHLRCAGEEYYQIVKPHPRLSSATEKVGSVLVVHEKSDVPAAVRHLQAERLRLINAWKKWKAVEPEIYAIIRKHLT